MNDSTKKKQVVVAIPVHNETEKLPAVAVDLSRIRRHNAGFDIVLVDDGSTDGSVEIGKAYRWNIVQHAQNLGYGRSLQSAFYFAIQHGYQYVLTMDGDGQHVPDVLEDFLDERDRAEVVSGSRYLPDSKRMNEPLAANVNQFLVAVTNEMLGMSITDIGCGMKCIGIRAIKDSVFEQHGYLFPIEFWVHCAKHNLRIKEIPVPMIYIDRTNTLENKFGSIEELVHQATLVLIKSLSDVREGYAVAKSEERSWEKSRRLKRIANKIYPIIAQGGKEYSVPVNKALITLRSIIEASER